MILIQLNDNLFQKIKNKLIYIVGYNETYLDELCDKYDILNSIKGAIDDTSRKQGKHIFRERELEVNPYSTVRELPSEVVFLITDDYFNEAFEKIKENTFYLDEKKEIYFFANKETTYDLSYREKYKTEPLRDIILLRSGPHATGYVRGMDFSDNARALFEYMIKENLNDNYKLIWLVNNPEEFSHRYKELKNVDFLPYNGSVSENKSIRDEYYEALCLAKYIFFTDAYGFARNARHDQIRIQLWHGCGIKTRVNFVKCEKRYEYMTVIGKMYAELHAKEYGLRDDQLLITGYPKNDYLFHPLPDWKKKLNIPQANKYIFWLPTFRVTESIGLKNLNENTIKNEIGLPIINSTERFNILNELLSKNNILMIVKLHPFQDRNMIKVDNLSNVFVLENCNLIQNDIMINEILGHANALISDYSSVAIDYTLLDRPIAFTLDDYKEYEKSRGFNWPNVRDWLPGEELFTFEDFLTFVQEIADDKDFSQKKRRSLTKKFHSFFDDKSSERVIKRIIQSIKN